MKSFRFFILIFAAVQISLQVFIGASQTAYAANTDSLPPAPLFCASIDTIGARMLGQLTPVAKQSLANLYSPANLKLRQTSVQQELLQKRIAWDNERNQQYSKMLSLAQNDAQRTAVENFKSSVEEAIIARRQSVDTSISTYFTNTSTQLETQSGQLSAARENFIADITAAINSASSDCQAKKSAGEIRSNFQAKIATARTKLQTSRDAIVNYKTQLEAIRKAETTSINEAINVFQDSLNKARQTLVDELKKSGANTTQFDI